MVNINGRDYKTPNIPVVGICIDGCDPTYLNSVDMPHLQRIIDSGCSGLAQSVIPSFTNPNNIAIVTGVTPDINGIPGNYYFDEATNQEVMMDDPKYLRVPTILSAFAETGLDVAAITTKEKLRGFLSHNLRGISFSVEKGKLTTVAQNGICDISDLVGRIAPNIYDPEASVYCLEAGFQLLQRQHIDLMYLSTTDFVQHKFAPEAAQAIHFYKKLDYLLGEFHRKDVVIGITADHGMNDKIRNDGTPDIQYLESLLRDVGIKARVILPITDPHVVHHGGLGSFATVYTMPNDRANALDFLMNVPGVENVFEKHVAASKFSLPADRIGDLVVLGDRTTVLGRTPEWHDLSNVTKGLRSHGGIHESTVPFIVNRPLKAPYHQRLENNDMRNFDLFEVLCNGVEL